MKKAVQSGVRISSELPAVKAFADLSPAKRHEPVSRQLNDTRENMPFSASVLLKIRLVALALFPLLGLLFLALHQLGWAAYSFGYTILGAFETRSFYRKHFR